MSWPLVSLSELIVDEIGGISLGRDDFFDQGLPVIPKKAISADIDICEKSFAYTSHEIFSSYEKSFIDNSFVITVLRDLVPSGPNLGRICLLKESRAYLLAQGVYGFKLAPECDPRYLAYISNSPSFREQVLRVKVGSTQVHVRGSEYKKVSIPLPPLPEQKRIAAILDKADGIRRKRQQAIKLADDFLCSVFLEMFGDPVTNPKGWDIVELADIVSEGDRLNYGVVQPGDNNSDGIPLVRSGDLSELTPEINSLRRVSHAIDQKHKKSKLKGNEILIACVGSVGKVGWVTEQMKGWNIARAVTRIPIKDGVNREYIYRYLQSPIIQGYFEKETRAVAQPTLNVGLIAKTPIALPPIELQIEYLKIVSRISTIKEKFNSKGEVRLFESVSQKAFSGQL